jgi:hypothetical protein
VEQFSRAEVIEVFAKEIDALYGDETKRKDAVTQTAEIIPISCPLSAPDCPAFAQSLNPRLTH